MIHRGKLSAVLAVMLAGTAALCVIGIVILAAMDKQIPPTLTAVASGAIGALAGALYVPSSRRLPRAPQERSAPANPSP